MSDTAIARLQNDVTELRVDAAEQKSTISHVLDFKRTTEETLHEHGGEIGGLKENDAGMAADLRAVASRPTWAMVAKENPKLTAGVLIAIAFCWLLGDAVIGTISVDALGSKVDVVTTAAAHAPSAFDTTIESGGTDLIAPSPMP